MAYTLKNSAGSIADTYTVKACLIVDDDNTTVIDLVTANTISVHANVTKASGTWNSTTRYKFATKKSGDTTLQGVTWTGTKPSVTMTTGASVFIAYESATTNTSRGYVLAGTGNDGYLLAKMEGESDKWQYRAGSGIRWAASSGLTGSTAASFCLRWRDLGGDSNSWQGYYNPRDTEPLSDYGSASTANWVPATWEFDSFGGYDTQGTVEMDAYCVLVVQGQISQTDFDKLHTDWFGEMVSGGTSARYPGSMLLRPIGGGTTQDYYYGG